MVIEPSEKLEFQAPVEKTVTAPEEKKAQKPVAPIGLSIKEEPALDQKVPGNMLFGGSAKINPPARS